MTRVLLAEDDPPVRRLLRHLLERNLHCVVGEAADGREALAAVGRDRPDLLLLDIGLPEVGGLRVLETLRADPATADLPVVAISAVSGREVIERLIALRITDYLLKPLDVALVERRLARVLAGLGGGRAVGT